MPSYSDRPKPGPHHRVIPCWLRVPRIRITPRRIAAVLLLLGLGVLLARDQIWPPPDEEQVRELFEDLVAAWVDEDFEEVWDLCSRRMTDFEIKRRLDGWKSTDADSPDWRTIEEELGIEREDLLEMDAEEFYVALQEAFVERDPVGWRKAQAGFRALRIKNIRFKGDRAWIDCPPVADYPVSFWFTKEGGEWRFLGAGEMAPMRFLPRERMLAAFLPKLPNFENVRIVVEVGDDSISEATVGALRTHLHDLAQFYGKPGRELPTVLLDLHPDMSMEDFMKILDLPHLEGLHDVSFADTTASSPHPGVRINGVPVEQIAEVTALPDPVDRPALERIIGMGGDFGASGRHKLLRELREQRRGK